MSLTTLAADRIRLEALHGLMGRTPAKEAGLSVFNGHQCPVRGHGRVRTVRGSHCVDCLEAAAKIKEKAQRAGREAALRAARAELTRDLKAQELARLKAQEEAVKAQQKADRLKAARAKERARKRAERQADKTPGSVESDALEVIHCVPEGDAVDCLPWE